MGIRSYSIHIISSVFINDDESGLDRDYEVWLERPAPHAPIDQYSHNHTGEDNADALLTGQVVDQAALHGLLKKVRNLGMPLLAVNRVESRDTEQVSEVDRRKEDA